MNDYFSRRASVRQYLDKEIPGELLTSILEQASHAPNTGNMQLYSVIVTRTKEGKEKLAPAHFNQPAVTGCDVLLTVCIDINRFNRWCHARKAEPGLNNFQAFVYATIDAVIYAQQIVTVAELNGIGTCYMGTTTYNAPSIAGTLMLPAGVVPIATITMGYPVTPPVISDRLPVEAIVHNEVYHDYSVNDIDRFYGPKEALDENIEYTRINGKETLAQVFTDIRYTRRDNETFSTVLYNFLKDHGFPPPKLQ